MSWHEIQVTVNGQTYTSVVESRELLSDWLRHRIGLKGTHVGCEHGVCGSCTVMLRTKEPEGTSTGIVKAEAVRSCLMFAVQADGAEITTVEGLASGLDTLHPLQQAFMEEHGLQCGFCTPGFLMTLIPFLRDHPHPTADEIREAISGNICRCTGYQNIIRAVQRAVDKLAADSERWTESTAKGVS